MPLIQTPKGEMQGDMICFDWSKRWEGKGPTAGLLGRVGLERGNGLPPCVLCNLSIFLFFCGKPLFCPSVDANTEHTRVYSQPLRRICRPEIT
ncbi:hypothetical protein PAHAL_8G074700 [Panicum hallii]|jgi:hypothetical protein|uniref:Uncharacterized protein n=1 Tax=Panicum hallii TaxID=206008 RepID=A0A2T8I836_9POAL|nr:hypothetical protein PAHAL_8G074700 [Panicum hallii]